MIRTPMMLMLNTDDVLDHQQIRKSVQDIAHNGFDAICFEFRRSQYDEFDKTGMAAMQVAYQEAKRLGIGFIKTLPTRHSTLIVRHPEVKRRHMVELPCTLDNEAVRLAWPLQAPDVPDLLLRAFRIATNAQNEITEAVDRTQDVTWRAEDGAVYIKASVPGEYLLYFSFYIVDTENRVTDCTDVDYANDLVLDVFDELLEVYSSCQLDGYCMDEFGAGTRKQGQYLANSCFFEKFQAKYGYDLCDKLYMLQHNTPGTEAPKVRFDYFDLTIDITHRYQMRAKEKFTGRYGKDIFIGFHHTFWGEGNSGDLWGGNIDYFRLASVLSGGFTDSQYDTERTMLSMTALAEGLAKYSDSAMAYNMCWDRVTTPEKMDYYHRMLAIRNVNWVGHAVAKGLQGTSRGNGTNTKIFFAGAYVTQLADNPSWGNVSRVTAREHCFSDFIGNAASDAKVAVVYTWESNAYYNSDYMHYHKLSIKALLDKLLTANIPTDVLPSFETDFSAYDVLIVPWPAMMPKKLWEALKRAIAQGKHIYFMGPPAYMTTDGADISGEFGRLIGTEIMEQGTYFGGHEYPAWDLWFTNKVIPMVTYCQDFCPIEAVNGNVRYYGYEAPLTEAMFRITQELAPYRVTKSSDVLSKTFAKEDLRILTLTSRWNARMDETFLFDGNSIRIENGILVGIKSRAGEVIEIISEEGARISVNGCEYPYSLI